MTKKILSTSLVVTSFLAQNLAWAEKRTPSSLERPPQFVLLAFDGSSSLDMWKQTVDFAATVQTTGLDGKKQHIGFTYFINPTYYTESAHKQNYITPAINKSVSCIGWADPVGSVLARVQATDNAYVNGHEIGSHANSHCSANGLAEDPLKGHAWTEQNWDSEFEQFNNLLFNAFANNGIKTSYVMKVPKSEIVGFRAPALAVTPGLWPTLKKFGFRYDTSQTRGPNYWPERLSWGGWNFPLGEIKATWRSKPIQSMDYTWLANQSGGASLPTPEKCSTLKPGANKWCDKGIMLTAAKIKEIHGQMLESYLYYFKKNYFGNRGPVQIGHHFGLWNGGAYWSAMKDFAKAVCGKPEVKCVTMKDYATYLDGLSAPELAAYQAGNAASFPRLADDKTIKDIAASVAVTVHLKIKGGTYEVVTEAKEKALLQSLGLSKQLSVDFQTAKSAAINGTAKITDEELAKIAGKGTEALVRASLVNKSGKEIVWETYKVKNVGTPEQSVSSQSIEDSASSGDSAEAHAEE